jgi:hypothetical protein
MPFDAEGILNRKKFTLTEKGLSLQRGHTTGERFVRKMSSLVLNVFAGLAMPRRGAKVTLVKERSAYNDVLNGNTRLSSERCDGLHLQSLPLRCTLRLMQDSCTV